MVQTKEHAREKIYDFITIYAHYLLLQSTDDVHKQ